MNVETVRIVFAPAVESVLTGVTCTGKAQAAGATSSAADGAGATPAKAAGGGWGATFLQGNKAAQQAGADAIAKGAACLDEVFCVVLLKTRSLPCV